MTGTMSEIKAKANSHMRRDLEDGKEWVCECADCVELRNLIGMDKVLALRPLVRDIEKIEVKMLGLADGPERRLLMDEFLKLHDQVAKVMAS